MYYQPNACTSCLIEDKGHKSLMIDQHYQMCEVLLTPPLVTSVLIVNPAYRC